MVRRTLQDKELKILARQYLEELVIRIKDEQQNNATFFDGWIYSIIDALNKCDESLTWDECCQRIPGQDGSNMRHGLERLRRFLELRSAQRFVEFEDRCAVPDFDIESSIIALSQGVNGAMRWKGIPLFKTTFDFCIYNMLLWDLKPRTVIEIGSAAGGSAAWMADLLSEFDVDAMVYSFDLIKPPLEYKGVRFLQGDCNNIEKTLTSELLESLPHPIMIIEDAHINVTGVLSHLHACLKAGDYLIVEDSANKIDDIRTFISRFPDRYLVDTHYTDFYGRNAVCSVNSIFKVQAEEV